MNTKLRFSILLSITYLLISTSLINAQWEPDQWIVNVPMPWGGGAGYTSYSRSLATNNSNVHVVWHDVRNGNWEICYKRSSDRGTTWGSATL